MSFVPDTISFRRGFIPDTKNPPSVGGFAQNIVKSGAKTITDFLGAGANILNPNPQQNTLMNIARLGVGVGQKLDPTEGNKIISVLASSIPGMAYALGSLTQEDQEKVADQVAQFYKNRYGSIENIQRTLYEDPVGAATDVASLLSLGGGALAKGGKIANASNVARVGGAIEKVGKFADPLSFVGRVVEKPLGFIGSKAAKLADYGADRFATGGINQGKRLRSAFEKGGYSSGRDMIDANNLWDRSPESALAAAQAKSAAQDVLFQNAQKSVRVGNVFRSIDNEIAQLAPEARFSELARSQMESLIRRRNDIEKGLLQEGSVPLEMRAGDLAEIKRSIGRDIKPTNWEKMQDNISAGSQAAARKAYGVLIKQLEDAAPGSQQLGREASALYDYTDLLKSAQDRSMTNKSLGLGKMLTGGFGGAMAGVPGVLGGLAVDAAVNSPIGARVLSGASKGISVGMRKIPEMGRFSFPFSGVSRVGRMINPSLSQDNVPPPVPQIPKKDAQKTAESAQMEQNVSGMIRTSPAVDRSKIYKQKALQYRSPKISSRNNASFGKVTKIKQGNFV